MSGLRRGDLVQAFTKLGARLDTCRAEQAEKRRQHAPGFSVFDFIQPTENVLSDVLAFFLNPRSSHGQGMLFLKHFIGIARPDLAVMSSDADVAREVLTFSIARNRRKIDIVATAAEFVLGIENKKYTGEGWNQIEDYSRHIANIAGRRPFCVILLNRTGAEAVSISPEIAQPLKVRRELMSWSWEKDVPKWLARCRAECGADKIRHFIQDFEQYIRDYLATMTTTDDENAE